jgi:hypothetical protein
MHRGEAELRADALGRRRERDIDVKSTRGHPLLRVTAGPLPRHVATARTTIR